MHLVDILSTLIVVGILVWAVNTHIPTTGTIKNGANVVLGLLIVGMVLWLINTYVPMAGSIKAILNIVVVLATCVQVLRTFGLWPRIVGMWNEFRARRIAAAAERPAEPKNQPTPTTTAIVKT